MKLTDEQYSLLKEPVSIIEDHVYSQIAVKLINALQTYGIHTVEGLLMCPLDEIKGIPEIGPTNVENLMYAVEKMGFPVPAEYQGLTVKKAAPLPSEEEIQRRAAEVREGWSEADHYRAAGQNVPAEYAKNDTEGAYTQLCRTELKVVVDPISLGMRGSI